MILQSAVQPYEHYGNLSYVIQVDTASPQPMQRHIWLKEDGSESVDSWIPTIAESIESLKVRGWIEV
jgi:hypothetical protein